MQAREYLERALEISEKHYGKDHIEVIKPLNGLGNVYFYLGDYNKAKDCLKKEN